jgi:hypothetical protein
MNLEQQVDTASCRAWSRRYIATSGKMPLRSLAAASMFALASLFALGGCGSNSTPTSTSTETAASTATTGEPAGDTVKVGILHSLTGTMAISEVSVKDATMMAIDEINEKGGVMGKKIEAVVEDGASDWPTFKTKAGKAADTGQSRRRLRLLDKCFAQNRAADF